MEQFERQILEILREHEGQECAIPVSELQRLVLAPTRKIRAAIARLVIEERIPIASSVHPPYGFYLITNEAEATRCLQQYWSRVREVSRRATVLNSVVKERFGIDVQQEFPFDGDAAR